MEISRIDSIRYLIDYYDVTDTNHNGRVEAGEITKAEIQAYDLNSDNALSPWEIMEAVNQSNPTQIFSPEEIITMRKLNSQGITFSDITLESDNFIQGIFFLAGTRIVFNHNGRINYCVLSADTPIHGLLLSGGVEVGFDEDGHIAYVVIPEGTPPIDIDRFCREYHSRPHHIGPRVGEFCMRGGPPITGEGQPIAGYAPPHVTYYSDHQLERINGVIRRGLLLRDTPQRIFAEDGSFQEITLKTGTMASYDERGTFIGGVLAEDVEINVQQQSIKFKAETNILFHVLYPDNGHFFHRVAQGELLETTPLPVGNQEIKFKAGTEIEFYENGQVKEGTLAENKDIDISAAGAVLQTIKFKEGTRATFAEDGRFSSGTLAEDTLIQRIGFRSINLLAGTEVHFGDIGQVLYVKLAASHIFDGIEFRFGSEVHFDGDPPVFFSLIEFLSGSELELERLFNLGLAINADNYGITFEDPEDPGESLLDPDNLRRLLDSHDNSRIEAYVEMLITKINSLLTLPNFYEIWLAKGKNLVADEETQALLQGLIDATESYRVNSYSDLSGLEQSRISWLNRLLIEATYPELSPIRQMGQVNHALIFEDTTFQGIEFPAGSDVYFRNGRLSKARISEDTPIQGTEFQEGTWVWFNESDGLVASGTLAADTTFRIMDREIELKEGELISFYRNSRQVSSGTLAEDTTFWIEGQEIELEDGTPVLFYENNPQSLLRGVWLHENLTLQMQGGRAEFMGGYIDWAHPPRDDNVWCEFFGIKFVGELCDWIKWREWEWRGWRWSGEQMLWIYENGRIQEGTLAADTPLEVGGQTLTFKNGKVIRFHQNGQVAEGTLAADTDMQINGQNTELKAETILTFRENGQLLSAQLSADTRIYSGGQWILFKAGTIVSFHDNGQVENGILAAEETTLYSGDREITLPSGTEVRGTEVWLSESGQLISARLSRDTSFSFQNLELKARTVVDFGNGWIWSATLSADTPIDLPNSEGQLIFKAGSTVQFSNGRILEGILADCSLSILGETIGLRSGTKIRFDSSTGQIRYLELAEITRIRGVRFKARTIVGFNENGILEHGTLAEDTTFKIPAPDGTTQDITLEEGTNVWLYENGNVWFGTLAAAADLGGSLREAGTIVWFKADGQFSSAQRASEDDNPYI